MKTTRETILILHNIRSNHNVGSIFRTADSVSVSKIFLTGYSATPLDRFKKEVKEVVKTALGAEKTISWEKVKSVTTLIKKLKKEGFQIIAIEQDKKSVDYKKVNPNSKVVFILGNEVDGIEKKILKLSDVIAEIPMSGKKESLNVSVATGVALFRILGL